MFRFVLKRRYYRKGSAMYILHTLIATELLTHILVIAHGHGHSRLSNLVLIGRHTVLFIHHLRIVHHLRVLHSFMVFENEHIVGDQLHCRFEIYYILKYIIFWKNKTVLKNNIPHGLLIPLILHILLHVRLHSNLSDILIHVHRPHIHPYEIKLSNLSITYYADYVICQLRNS